MGDIRCHNGIEEVVGSGEGELGTMGGVGERFKEYRLDNLPFQKAIYFSPTSIAYCSFDSGFISYNQETLTTGFDTE